MKSLVRKWPLLLTTLLACPAVAMAADGEGKYSPSDSIWILLGAILVFFMQPGFAMVETGMTRAKNAGNIVMKNFMDFSIGTVAFWIIGFGLMFGTDIGGIIGTPDFFVTAYDPGPDAGYTQLDYLFFQTVFCATSATIVSGSMAERTKFSSYCLYSLLISLIIYPISGHWIWGGGWLSELGFHDFAGSTCVHMVGGVCAAVGAAMLGPRIGKYNKDGTANAIPGHSITLACLGMFILWMGWFGFNGGSTVSMTGDDVIENVGLIMVNTNMAAAVGACTTMCVTWLKYGKPDVSMTLNGGLAGLVAITAGCDTVSVAGSFFIGLIAGIVIVYSVEFVDQKLKIDDPVGAISAHGVCGALGTILTGLFSTSDGLFYTGNPHFFFIQILGVVAVAIYVFIAINIVFRAIKATNGLRVTKEEEINGLDFEEHGLVSAYADFMMVPDTVGAQIEAAEPPKDAVEVPLDKEEPAPLPKEVPADGHRLYNVTIITSDKRFEALKAAMEAIGITGMTVTKALGFGLEKGQTQMYRGAQVSAKLLPKIRVEMVVSAIPPRKIIEVAKKVLYTGKYGDGKVFVSTIDNAVKIRTGEEGFAALQDYPIGEDPVAKGEKPKAEEK
ncbi:ammonium transporter [Dialister sp.]|uniref:ammonium transporter n=1 Tax=Dialister sp. TaxID=1955814 RepID=UPI002E814582|nr:ammonium transporter [Dialister sp.]MEE3453741.1 ammonium transporter [Dialister sp.]